MNSRMLVWFSCGAASAVAAKIAVEQYSDRFDVEVCYCDLLADEHPDNARFLKDVEAWIGQPIKILSHPDYKDIYDVFRRRKYIVGPRGAQCTVILKKQVRINYQRPDDVHVLGYTSDEAERAKKFEAYSPELDCEWVLIDRDIDKNDCHIMIERAGIAMPEMYRLGYNHNNCLGCVKGGMGYWNKVRRDFPDRFAEMAKIEREIGATILRRDGERLYLDELEPDAGTHDDLVVDCGVFCESNGDRVEMLVNGRNNKEQPNER